MSSVPAADFLPDTPLILGMMRLQDHGDLTRPANLARSAGKSGSSRLV